MALCLAAACLAGFAGSLVRPAAADASASLSGTVLYNDMSPASRVLVSIVPNHVGVVTVYDALSATNGEWSRGGIPEGEYSILFIVVTPINETRASKKLTLHDGESLSLGTVVVGPPAVSKGVLPGPEGQGTLDASVATASGMPAAEANVTFTGEHPVMSGKVSRGGHYVAKATEGTYTVTITDAPPDAATSTSVTGQVTVTAGQTTTASFTLPPAAPASVPAGVAAANTQTTLAYLNAERRRWGLPSAVTANPDWSQACAAHDAFDHLNHVVEHPENHPLGKSAGGAWAGANSILTGGPSDWEPEANPFENAPFHLNQLFTPDLSVVGIDSSQNGVCVTTWPGIFYPQFTPGTVFTYPGDGTTGFPPQESAYEWPITPPQLIGLKEGTVTGREIFVYEEPGICIVGLCVELLSAPDVTAASLIGPSGPVPVKTVNDGLETGAILIPTSPLAGNARYTASVTLAAKEDTGVPQEVHQWSFVTGPPNPSGEWPGRAAVRYRQATLSGLRVSPSSIYVRHARPHARLGATVQYWDSAPATTGITVSRIVRGVYSNHRCVSLPKKAKRARPCNRAVSAYSFTHADRPGMNRVPFRGVQGRAILARGRYVMQATTMLPGYQSTTETVPFAVIG
jgi:hypothetical protein